jgi:hypothetical protein
MGYFVVRIRADSWDRLRDLQRVHDVDVVRQTARRLDDRLFEIEALASERDIERLSAAGYQVETIADAERIASERQRDLSGRG